MKCFTYNPISTFTPDIKLNIILYFVSFILSSYGNGSYGTNNTFVCHRLLEGPYKLSNKEFILSGRNLRRAYVKTSRLRIRGKK